jgi:hypothetical protein
MSAKILTQNTQMGASGPNHAPGFVPDPGSTPGTTKFLREDATFAVALQSVGLTFPGIFTITGSPLTANGTITATLATQTANTFWAGPASGTAAAPTFRALTTADLPSGTLAAIGGAALAGATFTGTVHAPEFDTSASGGIVIPDTTNGNTYRLQVVSGVLTLTLV